MMKKLYYAEGTIFVESFYYVGNGEDPRKVGRQALINDVNEFDVEVEVAEEVLPDSINEDNTDFRTMVLHFVAPGDPSTGEAWLEEANKTPEQRAAEAAYREFLLRQLRLPGVD